MACPTPTKQTELESALGHAQRAYQFRDGKPNGYAHEVVITVQRAIREDANQRRAFDDIHVAAGAILFSLENEDLSDEHVTRAIAELIRDVAATGQTQVAACPPAN